MSEKYVEGKESEWKPNENDNSVKTSQCEKHESFILWIEIYDLCWRKVETAAPGVCEGVLKKCHATLNVFVECLSAADIKEIDFYEWIDGVRRRRVGKPELGEGRQRKKALAMYSHH